MISAANGDIIELVRSQDLGCIVNPANATMSEGGALCGQIYREADSGLLTAAEVSVKGIGEGSSVLTKGFKLCEYIIHTLAPRDTSYKKWERLQSCYLSILDIAGRLQEGGYIHTVAIPAIGTGVFNLPARQADEIAYTTIRDWQDTMSHGLDVVLCFQEQVRWQAMLDRGAFHFTWDDINYGELRLAEGGYGE